MKNIFSSMDYLQQVLHLEPQALKFSPAMMQRKYIPTVPQLFFAQRIV